MAADLRAGPQGVADGRGYERSGRAGTHVAGLVCCQCAPGPLQTCCPCPRC